MAKPELSKPDPEFVTKAAQDGIVEIEMAKLAALRWFSRQDRTLGGRRVLATAIGGSPHCVEIYSPENDIRHPDGEMKTRLSLCYRLRTPMLIK